MDHAFADELEVALREQGFGIAGYQIEPTPSDRAVIKLLDNGRTIYVKLSLRGWEVLDHGGAPIHGQQYETLDNLLRANSPAWSKRETERLFTKLIELIKSDGVA